MLGGRVEDLAAHVHPGQCRLQQQNWKLLAKVDMCCEIIANVLQHTEEKIIIFSQFTILLDLLEVSISARGWEFVRFDGSMTAEARNEAVLSLLLRLRQACRRAAVSGSKGGSGLIETSTEGNEASCRLPTTPSAGSGRACVRLVAGAGLSYLNQVKVQKEEEEEEEEEGEKRGRRGPLYSR